MNDEIKIVIPRVFQIMNNERQARNNAFLETTKRCFDIFKFLTKDNAISVFKVVKENGVKNIRCIF
jgi:hypothetical protein